MMNNTNLNKADFAGTIWGNLTIWRIFMKYWYFYLYSSPLMNLASTRASLAEGCSHNICKFKSRSPCFGSAASGGNASRSFRREHSNWSEEREDVEWEWELLYMWSLPVLLALYLHLLAVYMNTQLPYAFQLCLKHKYENTEYPPDGRPPIWSWDSIFPSPVFLNETVLMRNVDYLSGFRLLQCSCEGPVGPAVRIIISSTVRYNEGKCSRKKVRLITIRCVWHVENWKQMYPNQVAD